MRQSIFQFSKWIRLFAISGVVTFIAAPANADSIIDQVFHPDYIATELQQWFGTDSLVQAVQTDRRQFPREVREEIIQRFAPAVLPERTNNIVQTADAVQKSATFQYLRAKMRQECNSRSAFFSCNTDGFTMVFNGLPGLRNDARVQCHANVIWQEATGLFQKTESDVYLEFSNCYLLTDDQDSLQRRPYSIVNRKFDQHRPLILSLSEQEKRGFTFTKPEASTPAIEVPATKSESHQETTVWLNSVEDVLKFEPAADGGQALYCEIPEKTICILDSPLPSGAACSCKGTSGGVAKQ